MKKRIVLCLAMAGIFPAVQAQTVVIDSQVTLAEALAGSSAPQEVLDSLAIADVEYYSFDGKLHRGQIVMHKTLKEDVIHLFRFMRNQRFQTERRDLHGHLEQLLFVSLPPNLDLQQR